MVTSLDVKNDSTGDSMEKSIRVKLREDTLEILKSRASQEGFATMPELIQELVESYIEDKMFYLTEKALIAKFDRVAKENGWTGHKEMCREVMLMVLRDNLIPKKIS